MDVQLFKACLRGNGGNHVFLIFWSSTSTMSMLKLPNASSMSATLSLPLHQITSRLRKPPEMKELFNDGISRFALSLSFLKKLAILFSFFRRAFACPFYQVYILNQNDPFFELRL